MKRKDRSGDRHIVERKDAVCHLCSACHPVSALIKKTRLIAAEPKAGTEPENSFFCPKLKAAGEIVYSPDRLTAPLLKKLEGDWEKTSWSEAMAHIARRLSDFKERHGAESVCWIAGPSPDYGAPWQYARRFMHAFGSPNVFGNGSICHAAREMAHVFTYGAMTYPDYAHSRCIVVWGKNDRDSNPGAFTDIRRARKRGAGLLVVDPVKTETASMADLWLQVKPGGDGILAMSMIHVLLSEGLYDHDFVNAWSVGLDALKRVAEKYEPEKVGPRIWLEGKLIRAAARLYATTTPACLIDGNGLDMHLSVSQNTRALCILRSLTGNLDRKGGDLIPQPVPTRDFQLKELLPNHVPAISHEYPLFRHYHERRGDHVLGALVDSILDAKPYPVKALIVQGANPAVTMANSKRVVQALKKLEFLVVIDLFMTRTASLAHLVLPAVTCFEKTQLNLRAVANNRVTLQNQVIPCFENSWPDWKIIFELAKKMGYGREFPWQDVEEAVNYQLEPAGITVDMLRENPEGIVFEAFLFEKYRTRGFATPSGKVEIFSQRYKDYGYAGIPDFVEEEENGLSFYDQRETYPLIGMSGGRSKNFVHSQFRNIPYLLKRQPEPFVDIHRDDAARLHIHDGARVSIETPNGSITMKAKVSALVHQGSVRIAWGWGESMGEWNLNDLTDDSRKDPLCSATSNRRFMCRISGPL
jgi:anaerobic selenocysteine-containing dehydrogenase